MPAPRSVETPPKPLISTNHHDLWSFLGIVNQVDERDVTPAASALVESRQQVSRDSIHPLHGPGRKVQGTPLRLCTLTEPNEEMAPEHRIAAQVRLLPRRSMSSTSRDREGCGLHIASYASSGFNTILFSDRTVSPTRTAFRPRVSVRRICLVGPDMAKSTARSVSTEAPTRPMRPLSRMNRPTDEVVGRSSLTVTGWYPDEI